MLSFILDILSVPAVLIGLVSMIGLIAQKKGLSDILKGSIKTIMGVLIPWRRRRPRRRRAHAFRHDVSVRLRHQRRCSAQRGDRRYGAEGVRHADSAHHGVRHGGEHPHCALYAAEIHLSHGPSHALYGVHDRHYPHRRRTAGHALVVVGAVLLGFVMALFPAIAHPTMKKITGSDDVAFGHFSTLGYVLSAWVGSLVGNREKTTEDINFPQSLAFLRDSSLAVSLVMLVLSSSSPRLRSAVCGDRAERRAELPRRSR